MECLHPAAEICEVSSDEIEHYSGVGIKSDVDLKRKDWKPPFGDSGQNSLECWDYTVELEMLKGPSDLHLAAELGKTLLERNRELESTIKDLKNVIEDKTQEIEYLSKQTTALREVNNSRLRIYEQLEISIQELEKNNQRLNAESYADKKKIKSLNETVEHLELKCDELRNSPTVNSSLAHHDEGQTLTQRSTLLKEGNASPRSCQNDANIVNEVDSEVSDLKMRIANLKDKLQAARDQYMNETKRREEFEIELSCLSQENYGLKEQIAIFKDKEISSKAFDDELTSPDTTTSSMFCRKCMGLNDETGSNITMQDITDDLEDMDEPFDAIHGECALVRLKNGGYAWGSQESLASMGHVVSRGDSKNTSPGTDVSGAPHNSLLSELDNQYRVLIEKYEALVEANEQLEFKTKENNFDSEKNRVNFNSEAYVHSGVDEESGPMGFVITETASPTQLGADASLRCQRCTTCSCDLKPTEPRTKPNPEELSEGETASSGFSEEERRFCAKMTQTEGFDWNCYIREMTDEATTPTPLTSTFRYLDLKSPLNPCENRFQNVPEVQKLFSEIFENLKKTSEQDGDLLETKSQSNEEGKKASGEKKANGSSEGSSSRNSSISRKKANKENKKPSQTTKEGTKNVTESESSTNSNALEVLDLQNITKPTRPDSLDLETASTCSSRSSRRRRHNHSSRHKQEEIKSTERNSSEQNNTLKEVKEANRVERIENAVEASSSRDSDVQTSHKPVNVTDSSKGKCQHKLRKKKQQKAKAIQIQNKHLNNVLGRSSPSQSPVKSGANRHFTSSTQSMTLSQMLPSVQVAKLIKVEKSYAEVLKSNSKSRMY